MLLGICSGADGEDADKDTDGSDDAEFRACTLHVVPPLKTRP